MGLGPRIHVDARIDFENMDVRTQEGTQQLLVECLRNNLIEQHNACEKWARYMNTIALRQNNQIAHQSTLQLFGPWVKDTLNSFFEDSVRSELKEAADRWQNSCVYAMAPGQLSRWPMLLLELFEGDPRKQALLATVLEGLQIQATFVQTVAMHTSDEILNRSKSFDSAP